MTTLNISLPAPLRDYVEIRAESGSYSTSEYIRQLIREDKMRHERDQRDLLLDLLAISAKQLDEDKGVAFDVDDIIERGRARQAARATS
jgi:Arc/MetJ-type ribon-helix-helix transcriptional regulator